MKDKLIMDETKMQRTLMRLTYEIIEQNKVLEDIVLVGIKTRGAYLAQRISENIERLEHCHVPVAVLDVSDYRDDKQHKIKTNTTLTETVTNKIVVLVDDVLYTGRTIRAAMDAVIDNGRPRQIALTVLIDRGHREFPIRADYVGKNIPTSREESIAVHVKDIDDTDAVQLLSH